MDKAARTAWVLIGLCCLFGLGGIAESAAPEVPIVNLYRGEINGTRFAALTADILRNLFGPPSAIETPESRQEGQETDMHYHGLGLAFGMYQPKAQTRLQCWRVRIYLVKTWDARAGMFFLPFPGRVSKQVNQDWTPQRIETEFRQWYAQSYPQAQAPALGHEPQSPPAAQGTYRVLYLDMSDFRIDFFYAPTEQRLQAMQLTLPRTVQPAPR